ncbi:RNA methyltransferase [Candidatus Babeliales bacterium]|nr:RNA methyltransferase [Candidatus Babeliales bacterium]MBP9844142.1 RNA methyltransferase [Candidatus Babeliales bacterium]
MKKKQPVKYTNVIYGVHPIIELLQSKRLKIGAIYTLKNPIKSWTSISKMIPSHIQVSMVTRETLDNVAGSKDHQGILAFVGDFPFSQAMFTPDKQKFVVVLDEIQDVRNLGAILRSAYCTGVDGVVLVRANAASLTASAIKASAGLAIHLPIHLASTVKSAVIELKKSGYHIYSATLGGTESVANFQFQDPAVLIIGNEEVGISADVARLGTRILLPQRRSDISYNASVAGGILMYTIGLQLKKI